METFEKVLQWIKDLEPWRVVISGGEPFMHPNIYEMCKKLKCLFIVTSNGNFITNPFLKRTAIAIGNLPNCNGIQITSVNGLYPNYWNIIKHQKEFLDIPMVNMCIDINIHIKDLGRAKDNFPVDSTYPAASCTNLHLVAKQTKSLQETIAELNKRDKFCKPLIDYQGKIHASESWLCPSYGTVDTPYNVVWQRLKDSLPCGKCANWKAMLNTSKYSKVIEYFLNN
jgi:organic radical activating enzyme